MTLRPPEPMPQPPDSLARAPIAQLHDDLVQWLENDRGDATHWTGTLAPSALSTATAISALAVVRNHARSPHPSANNSLIDRGLRWLAQHQNPDGGFGDTDRSPSNIATTALVRAAWKLTGWDGQHPEAATRLDRAFEQLGSWEGLRRRYGVDKTFVVPILTNCALAGLCDWREVSQLPFPAACLPQSVYRFARLPVVSYAIPALVAIGQARFHHVPPRFAPLRWLLQRAVEPSLKVLERMQPASGGYLEATPLTSFVLMSLASKGLSEHPVSQSAVRFLSDSILPDGSWPIDTNLATWLTSLAIRAICPRRTLPPAVLEWLLSCQHRVRHPFTGADPGGWGWTDLSGAVPDGDDTPAALLAIHRWRLAEPDITHRTGIRESIESGIQWLLGLQNRDGGWPTFCRGWGKLPFDRSGSDLTAHALRALHVWRSEVPEKLGARIGRAADRGWRYLERTQRADGSWLPLWFGNHEEMDDENPFYGTAKVLLAGGDCGFENSEMMQRGKRYLLARQNADGGWGGGKDVTAWLRDAGLATTDGRAIELTSTVEETSVVLEGLISLGVTSSHPRAIIDAVRWLRLALDSERMHAGWPIGFYFAKLWYHERLYPAIFATSAVGRLLDWLDDPARSGMNDSTHHKPCETDARNDD